VSRNRHGDWAAAAWASTPNTPAAKILRFMSPRPLPGPTREYAGRIVQGSAPGAPASAAAEQAAADNEQAGHRLAPVWRRRTGEEQPQGRQQRCGIGQAAEYSQVAVLGALVPQPEGDAHRPQAHGQDCPQRARL